MLLTIVNNTASPISLLSGSVVVPASGTIAVTNTTFQYQLATDGFCKQNIVQGNLSVSDGTNTFGSTDAINYLYLLFQALGPLADGAGNQAVIKLANTSPVAADQALVVALSPNSSPLNSASGSGTISALNGTVVITAGAAVTWSLSGTWVGTLTTQAQSGDGQWWNVASLSNQSGLITNGTSINGVLEMNAAGWTQARIIATTWTSGTVIVTWNSTSGQHLSIPYSSNGANFNTYTTLTDSSQNPLGTTAASTAATAAQEALVVAFSPNSPLPAGSALIGSINNISGTISLPTGAATSANQTTEITSLQLIDNPIGSVAAGTAGTSSSLIGLVFNTALPTLTNGQQAAAQADSSGRLIISPLTNASIVKAQLQDNSGNALLSINNQLETRDVINVAGQNRAQSVTTTAAEALGAATILVNRKFLSIRPTNGIIYWGFTSGVTTVTGTPIYTNEVFTISVTDNVHVYVIAAATTDVRISEGS